MVATGFEVAASVMGVVAFSLKTLKFAYETTTKSFVNIGKNVEPHKKLENDAKLHRKNLANRGGDPEDVLLMDKCIAGFKHSHQKLKDCLKSVHESSAQAAKSMIMKTHIDSLYNSTNIKAAELAHAMALTKYESKNESDGVNQMITIPEHTISTLQPWSLHRNNAQLTSIGRDKENEFKKSLARGRRVAARGKTYAMREIPFDIDEEADNITQYSMSCIVQPTSTPGKVRIKGVFKVEAIY